MANKINIFEHAVIMPKSEISGGVEIGEFSVVGKKAPYLKKRKRTKLEKNVKIGTHVVIYEGAIIGSDTQIEDFCRIGEQTSIGKNGRIIYGSKIYGSVKIGNSCIIGGFICEDVEIGNNCRIFGELVHAHKVNPKSFNNIKAWDNGGEKAPKIGDNVFIGFGAKISGNIKIGSGSYILPNAVVTKNVPKNTLVKGINKTTSIEVLFPKRATKKDEKKKS